MPRTGPRRVMIATKGTSDDIDELDAIADAAGVKRSDVVRLALEIAIRGVDRERLVQLLAERGRESNEPLTTAQWDALRSA